jgi:hypothetical protein
MQIIRVGDHDAGWLLRRRPRGGVKGQDQDECQYPAHALQFYDMKRSRRAIPHFHQSKKFVP